MLTPLLLALVGSCTDPLVGGHCQELPPDRLAGLTRFGQAGEVDVRWGEETVRVTEDNRPQLGLVLRAPCCPEEGGDEDLCRRHLNLPLELARLEAGRVELDPDGWWPGAPAACRSLPLEQVEAVQLRLSRFVPAGWEPRFAVGWMVMGPALNLALNGQLHVTPWLTIESGFPLPRMQIGAHAGLRVRPVEIGPFRPFVGALAHYYWFEYEHDPTAAWGLRMGLDWEFGDRLAVLGVEVDLLRPLDPGSYTLMGMQGEWIPWTGMSIAMQL